MKKYVKNALSGYFKKKSQFILVNSMGETKKKIKSRKYTKKHCSPGSSNYKFSCFNKKSLIKIARAWNKSNPKNKIKINGRNIKDIWNQIDNRLKKKCNEENCWTRQEFVKKIKDSEIKKENYGKK